MSRGETTRKTARWCERGHASAFPNPARYSADVVPVFLDQFADMARGFRGVRSGVGDRTTQSNVIAHVVDSVRILEKVLDVLLPDAKAPVGVTSVVPFAMVAHCSASCSKYKASV